jgi:hypothetical protein
MSELIGWVGAAALLVGYGLLSLGRIRNSVSYQALNLAGAGGLALNGAVHHAWPSTVLNVIWLVISAAAILRMLLRPTVDQLRASE